MIKTSINVNGLTDPSSSNPHTLTPYVNDDGEIWLASNGSGCGDDVMIDDVTGWTANDINDHYRSIDLDAMEVAADEVEAAGDRESAEWIREWVRVCRDAMTVYATIDSRRDGTGDEYTDEFDSEAEAVSAAERDWNHLTAAEQAKRTISVGVSRRTDDGGFDFGSYDIVRTFGE